MNKRELINALEACPVPDDATVVLMNFTKMALGGEDDTDGQYTDFSVDAFNLNMTDDEKERHEEITGFPPEPIVSIAYDDPSDDPGGLLEDFDKRHGIKS